MFSSFSFLFFSVPATKKVKTSEAPVSPKSTEKKKGTEKKYRSLRGTVRLRKEKKKDEEEVMEGGGKEKVCLGKRWDSH